jgi:hypothetical protein
MKWIHALNRRAQALGNEAGMTTAEYAIGTVASCSFAGLLVTILRSDAVRQILTSIITKALGLGI